MKNIFLILLIQFILISIAVKAESVYQYGVTAEIYNNNSIHYELNIVFINHSSEVFSIPLSSPFNIKIESSAICKEQRGILETNVICSFDASDKTVISIQYDSNTVNKRDSYFLFSDSFKLTMDTRTITVLIKLPEATGLREPIKEAYSPSDALIGSDGRRSVINWVKNDLKSNDRFDVSIAFEKIGEKESSFPFEIVLVIVLISFFSLGVFYQFYWKGKNVKIILPILKKDEKKIFDSIMKNGSGVNQKMIIRDSGYSKAKVSKVLTSLRERGLVKLERIGRSNKVYIEKNFQKKS